MDIPTLVISASIFLLGLTTLIADEIDPALVVVFDLAGSVKDFRNAIDRIEGLEFLSELLGDRSDPDGRDFAAYRDRYRITNDTPLGPPPASEAQKIDAARARVALGAVRNAVAKGEPTQEAAAQRGASMTL